MKTVESAITGGFWGRWQAINREIAIFHQWDQLEKTGCIDNFRILAEGKAVTRKGWFFADSDAYKWLEAAFRILASAPDPRLSHLVDEFTHLVRGAQSPEGYLYTFNQIHFPEVRWVNLQIEHELYCHGHLIEACIAGYQAMDDDGVLLIARKAADLIVADFTGKGPRYTPGHEEIEIALLHLYEVTSQGEYLEMARQFLDQRGRIRRFGAEILKQNLSNAQRVKASQQMVAEQALRLGEDQASTLPPMNAAKSPPLIGARFLLSGLSGKLLQQHTPLASQSVPVGHAVRFAYLHTAGAMLDRLSGEPVYQAAIEKAWGRMVDRRMYITGGIGSLPKIEGFGRDDELDPGFAYAETCAALGSLFWNREMAKLTREAQYSDLYAWQLYNAALVGMGWGGDCYLYNNPLEATSAIERRSWYEVPCCPSNLSRTWATLQEDLVDGESGTVYIQQYISSRHTLRLNGNEVNFTIESALPWQGEVNLRVISAPITPFAFKLRQPSWTSTLSIGVNDEEVHTVNQRPPGTLMPQRASWLEVNRTWEDGDLLTVNLGLPIRVLRAHHKVRSVRGKVALARGPLVYCLESSDNPQVDIFATQLDPSSLTAAPADLFGGIVVIKGRSISGDVLTFIPYHLWGNRGQSQMSVFVRVVG